MTNPLVRLAMAGALAMGLAFAQTPAPQTPAAAPAKKVKTPAAKLRKRLIKQLELNTAQKQQAREIFKQAKTANQPVRAELKQNHESLSAAIKSNNVSQIDQLSQARANLMAKTLSTRSQAMAKFYATLTPDQKTKADQIQQKLAKRAQKIKG